jgi:hypothetical protein
MLQTLKVRSKCGQTQSKNMCEWGSAKGKGSGSGMPTLARNIYANNIKDPNGGCTNNARQNAKKILLGVRGALLRMTMEILVFVC